MNVTHDVGKTIECVHNGQRPPSWTLDYANKPKPFMHPVRTPVGQLLSLLEPADHLWHRGLWFTFKFVNGDNFWEENPPFGCQQVREIPRVTHDSADEVRVRMDLDWIAPGSEERIISERRSIRSQSGTDVTIIDWETTVVPELDVVLDRTPYTTWGGYGGLSFRGSRSWLVNRFLLPDGPVDGRPAGQAGTWCEMSGPLDGGASLTAGLAVLDHPDNPRYPTPWYAGGAGSGNFINAAMLFHEPLEVNAGDTLSLRYRVLIHDGVCGADRLRDEHMRYVDETRKGDST